MSTAVAPLPKRELTAQDRQIQNISDWIKKAEKSLKMALPKHMTAERMMRIAISGLSRNPLLLECTPQSIILALINASETGLEPNGYEAHLIPYWNSDRGVREAQFQPDYKGLVQLAYRSGQVISFDADAVYEADEFEYSNGSESILRHRPADKDDRGALKYAWACAKLTNGGVKFIVLTKAQVMKHKASAKSDKFWTKHEEAMWIKTAAKVLTKWIPRSAEMQRAIQLDDQAEMGVPQLPDSGIVDGLMAQQQQIDAEPQKPASKSEEIAKRLGNGRKPAPGEAEHDNQHGLQRPSAEREAGDEEINSDPGTVDPPEETAKAPFPDPNAAEPGEEGLAPDLLKVKEQINAQMTKQGVKELVDFHTGPASKFNEKGRQFVTQWGEAQNTRISSSRGPKSNKKTQGELIT